MMISDQDYTRILMPKFSNTPYLKPVKMRILHT